MIDFLNKIINSTINNLFDALAFLLIAIFYEMSVLQLPVPEVINMMGIVVIFTLGINTILASEKATVTNP